MSSGAPARPPVGTRSLPRRWWPQSRAEWATTASALVFFLAASGIQPALRLGAPQAAVDVIAFEQFPSMWDPDSHSRDPWGRPWIREYTPVPPLPSYSCFRFVRGGVTYNAVFYSAGPDRRDAGGAGDDLRPRSPRWWTPLASRRTLFLLGAFCILMVPWMRLGRSPQVGRELARAAVAAVPATAVLLPVVLGLKHLPILKALPTLTSPSVALALATATFCFLLMAAIRLTRPTPDTPAIRSVAPDSPELADDAGGV